VATCLKCGRKINRLIKKHVDVWETYYNGQNILLEERLSWSCPECGEVLFEGFPDSEVEATDWLAQ
jgi:YgiT-type zinc finger domain-containing protein